MADIEEIKNRIRKAEEEAKIREQARYAQLTAAAELRIESEELWGSLPQTITAVANDINTELNSDMYHLGFRSTKVEKEPGVVGEGDLTRGVTGQVSMRFVAKSDGELIARWRTIASGDHSQIMRLTEATPERIRELLLKHLDTLTAK